MSTRRVERDRQILVEYAAGYTALEIAEAVGLSDSGVLYILRRDGAEMRPPRQRPKVALRKACMKHRGKLSASKIARKLGITRNTVIGHWYRARQAASP